MPNKPIPEETQKIIRNLKKDGFSDHYIAKRVEHDRKTVKKYSENEEEEV